MHLTLTLTLTLALTLALALTLTLTLTLAYLDGQVLLLDDTAHVLGLGGGRHAHLLGVRVRLQG